MLIGIARARFVLLQAAGVLSSPAECARRLLAPLARADIRKP